MPSQRAKLLTPGAPSFARVLARRVGATHQRPVLVLIEQGRGSPQFLVPTLSQRRRQDGVPGHEHAWPLRWNGGWCKGDLSTTTFSSGQLSTGRVFTSGVFQTKLAIVLLDDPVALAGGVFKFPAVHDLHRTTGVLDELLPLQNTSCQAHGRSICP